MSNLSKADIDIIKAFNNNFGMLKADPIVLYGIGEKTRLIIDNLKEYNIVGLMDKNSSESDIYGKTILSADEVIGVAKTIVIISNFASSNLIYRRISHLEKQHGINVFHLNGSRPGELSSAEGNDAIEPFSFQTYEELKNRIDEKDIISIDIFDTLLMRKCLSPDDIFRKVERDLSEKHNININYTEMRIESENISFKKSNGAYSIDSIYHNMQKRFHLSHNDIALFKKIELDTEIEYIIPRDIIVDAIRYAKDSRKTVILTSDMYLPSSFIKKLLSVCNIYDNDYDELFISCEVNKTKYQGDLWFHYKEFYGGKKILHVGDNDFADITQANNHGINTFKIFSAFDLFCISSISDCRHVIKTFDDRLLMGNIIAILFNSPFVLSSSNKLKIDTPFTAGYAFFGPLILKFMLWLIKLSSELKLNKILFLSRDGYILERLYGKYLNAHSDHIVAKGIYFLTSRRALSVSSINTVEDIVEVCRLAPYVTKIKFNQFLFATFGLKAHDNDKFDNCFLYDTNIDDITTHILDQYKKDILRAARDERKCYQIYFNSLDIENNDKIGVVNFVSGGITQHFFESLFPNPCAHFIYFMTQVDFEDVGTHNDVHCLYGKNFSAYTSEGNSLIKYFLTAEAIFTSPDEQFVRFLKQGLPVFENSDTIREYQDISKFQEGMERFFVDNMNMDDNILKRDYNIELIDCIFGCLFSPDKCVLSPDIKKVFKIADNFSPKKIVETLEE